jgi:hypothetical protein
MRHAITAAAVAVSLALLAAPAQARTLTTVPADVPVMYEPCPPLPGAAGCYWDGKVYVASRGDKATLYHELGHIWIKRTVIESDHAWFARKLHAEHLPWRATRPGRPSVEEVLADAFMRCAQGWRPRPGRVEDTGYGYAPTPRQHRTICNAIAILGLVR